MKARGGRGQDQEGGAFGRPRLPLLRTSGQAGRARRNGCAGEAASPDCGAGGIGAGHPRFADLIPAGSSDCVIAWGKFGVRDCARLPKGMSGIARRAGHAEPKPQRRLVAKNSRNHALPTRSSCNRSTVAGFVWDPSDERFDVTPRRLDRLRPIYRPRFLVFSFSSDWTSMRETGKIKPIPTHTPTHSHTHTPTYMAR